VEELRLWGGEGKLNKPSDPRAPGPLHIDLLSPLPFSRLGVELLVKFRVLALLGVFGVLNFFVALAGVSGLSEDSIPALEGVTPPDRGLGGRLDVRTPI